jgi:hypothetical protein
MPAPNRIQLIMWETQAFDHFDILRRYLEHKGYFVYSTRILPMWRQIMCAQMRSISAAGRGKINI